MTWWGTYCVKVSLHVVHLQSTLDPTSVGLFQDLDQSFRLQHLSVSEVSRVKGQLSRGYYKLTWTSSFLLMDVDAVLAARQGQYGTTEVEKEVGLQFDLGNLLATDLNAVDTDALRWVLLNVLEVKVEGVLLKEPGYWLELQFTLQSETWIMK